MKIFTLLLLLGVAACAHVPLGTQVALARLDPMTADATAMRFAVEQPADLPLDTTASLHMSFTSQDGEVADQFTLARVQQPVSDGAIIRTIFAIAASDRARFNQLREEILAQKAAHPDGEGSISISASGCMTAPPPEGPWLVSVFIGIDGHSDWLPLIRDVDIRTLGPQTNTGTITPCAA